MWLDKKQQPRVWVGFILQGFILVEPPLDAMPISTPAHIGVLAGFFIFNVSWSMSKLFNDLSSSFLPEGKPRSTSVCHKVKYYFVTFDVYFSFESITNSGKVKGFYEEGIFCGEYDWDGCLVDSAKHEIYQKAIDAEIKDHQACESDY